jgi:hypothetical protein
MGSSHLVPITLLHNKTGINLAGWINTGTCIEGRPVTLHRCRFDSLPGLEMPKMTSSYTVFYAFQEFWNPQPTNNALEACVTDEIIVGWKGDVLIVKHGHHCEYCFADVANEECNMIVTAAIYNGEL